LTVIEKEPAVVRSEEGTDAVSEVLLPKVVVSAVLPQYTLAPLTKFVPVIVIVKVELPTAAVPGLIAVIVGIRALTVKVAGPDVAPLGFLTVIEKEPVAVRSVEGTVAVRDVLLPKVVVNAVLPQYTIAPFT